MFFQQFQVVLRNRLKQLDLVTEIPFGPPNSSVALDGPTFVDDDTVLLCADSPSQLIDTICEAARIYVDTARKFGLTLNFDKGKTEALVSWGRKGRSQVLAHEAVIHQNGALSLEILDRCSLSASSRSTNMLVHGSPVPPLHSAIFPTKSLAPPRGTCRQSLQSSQSNTRGSCASEPCKHWWNPDFSPMLADGRMSPCRRWPNSSQYVLVCSEKFWNVSDFCSETDLHGNDRCCWISATPSC